MSFTQSIKTCFQKYVTFSGRASRPEYWYFFLFIILGNIVTTVLDVTFFGVDLTITTDDASHTTTTEVHDNGPLGRLFSLATMIPLLAVGWRRMHDSGRSGLYLFFPLIAMIGIGLFLSFSAGTIAFTGGTLGLGGLATALGAVSLAILFPALVIGIFAPLLVIWWLTRPSDPNPNTYGPNPNEAPQ
ncbi:MULTISPECIES: DUF805 domain-containing protein [Halocynthiibacter]|uniref:DUF805 domain-containing protein n=1 Tax=Halocynthiibacter halioticoli TaxID=2986804 RepID=A0AAE3J1S1_9RHOB|nr:MULTISPECIES: DUF805 domain-containing protein [Halocynthiibacter]MCV6823592.1 DUF805 domain-containing protein [Halocynthiibacter halioticoli]MCW4056593.1 DUF805 domain-containing protein [Halocynthiibacter sp. SDUM655004]